MIAMADPGFAFDSWSVTYPSTSNPVWITLREDHEIRANFVSPFNPIHVDDDHPRPDCRQPQDKGGDTVISCIDSNAVFINGTVAGGWPGLGNRSSDPLFAGISRWVDPKNPAVVVEPDCPGAVWVMGDYHLKSRIGRWEFGAGQWLQDTVTSPCIDAGDPSMSVGQEPPPNGGRINLGAYGGTSQAGMSASGP